MTTTPEPDWKSIALQLAQRVNFAVTNLKAPGTGQLYNHERQEPISWRDYMADAMELIPGVTVDRELMHSLDLPKRERKKFLDARAAAKAHDPGI